MTHDYDVVVIGAGPIGGYLSRRLSEHGNSVLLVEEHAEEINLDLFNAQDW